MHFFFFHVCEGFGLIREGSLTHCERYLCIVKVQSHSVNMKKISLFQNSYKT